MDSGARDAGCKCVSQNPSDSALLIHPTRLAPMLVGRRSQRLGSSRHLAPSHVQKPYTNSQSIGGGEVRYFYAHDTSKPPL